MTLPDDIKAVVKTAMELHELWHVRYDPFKIEAAGLELSAKIKALSPESLKIIEDDEE